MMEHINNPHGVLGVAVDASAEDVRRAYLALVRQHPPDRDPARFREIHDAYQMLCDPLMQAEAMLKPSHERPDLHEVIAEGKRHPPRLPKLVLLALGDPK